MRTAFIQTLLETAEEDPRIFLVCGDLGYSVLEPFAARFPDRFLNAGVAEQNLTGVAAGLAREGYVVFTYSIGNFPTMRCLEQIRNDVCYHDMNVKIVAVGGGYAYGPLGASHHATEDLAILRALPRMSVLCPGDPAEARACARLAARNPGPAYVRLGKAGEPVVHASEPALEWGRWIRLESGRGTAILATGAMLHPARRWLDGKKNGYSLWSAPFIKPLDREALREIALAHDTLVTVEEHQASGGFGSAVLEALHDLHAEGRLGRLPAVRRFAIPDRFESMSGSQADLQRRAGLDLSALG